MKTEKDRKKITKILLNKGYKIYDTLHWKKSNIANAMGVSYKWLMDNWGAINSFFIHRKNHGVYGLKGEKGAKSKFTKVTRKSGNQFERRAREITLTPELLNTIKELSVAGFTKDKIACVIGVSRDCLYKWRDKYPRVKEALEYGKDLATGKVVMSLLKRATGMSMPDTYFAQYLGKIITAPRKKHLPPDVNAIELWLRNNAGWKSDGSMQNDSNKLKQVMKIAGKEIEF